MVKMIKMMPQILASDLYFACTCIPVIKRQAFGLSIWWSMLAFFAVSPWNVCRPPQSNEFGDVELNKDKSFFFFNWRISQGLKDSVYTTNLYAGPGMQCSQRDLITNVFVQNLKGLVSLGTYLKKYWSWPKAAPALIHCAVRKYFPHSSTF